MDDQECIQVVMTRPQREAFERWLRPLGMYLYRMPIDNPDDLDTYGIGIGARG